jgi:hypothetical protein
MFLNNEILMNFKFEGKKPIVFLQVLFFLQYWISANFAISVIVLNILSNV